MTFETEVKVRKVIRKVINVLSALMALTAICGLIACSNSTDNEYERYCIAITEDKIQTNDGNVWVGDRELWVGKTYKVVFTDNGTPDIIEDDLIISEELCD